MSRPFRAPGLVAVVVLLAATGCQDYNFNPVGHCVLQPGSQRFTLSNVSSADVLFVVDDSGSMAGKQAHLADAFADFVDNLTSTNLGRARGGLLPLDFHVAVTTTSIFVNREPLTPQTCSATCGAATGTLACCVGNVPQYGPRRCTTLGATTGQCPVAGTSCSNTCNGLKGELFCCASTGSFPPNAVNSVGGQLVQCQKAGLPCGALETHYNFAGQCDPATQGVALDGLPFPDGAFVGSTSVGQSVANPRVLHFDKRLYLSGANSQGFSIDQLKRFFEQNVRVGTCGSEEEQGLQASRRAVAAALAGTQLDTYAYDWAAGVTSGTSSLASQTFTVAPGGVPTLVSPAVWPTPNSKLVVVYVGDEDDCSSPKDPSAGVLLLNTDVPGADACTRDATDTSGLGGKEYGVSSFVSYLTGLGRPLGAAFVVSAVSATDPTTCANDTCVAGLCCDFSCSTACPPQIGGTCGGQAPGKRFVDAAHQLKTAGADVVIGAVCGDFRPMLRSVAEIVKPPQTLSLPTLPAESAITILRIAGSDGQTRKICGRPLVPTQPSYTRLTAEATGADWWFVASGDPGPPFDPTGASTVAVPSKFVYINPRGSCIANPGETYSADYLGIVPAGGCQITPVTDPLGALDCQGKLGGRATDWQCYVPPGLKTGTCTCQGGG